MVQVRDYLELLMLQTFRVECNDISSKWEFFSFSSVLLMFASLNIIIIIVPRWEFRCERNNGNRKIREIRLVARLSIPTLFTHQQKKLNLFMKTFNSSQLRLIALISIRTLQLHRIHILLSENAVTLRCCEVDKSRREKHRQRVGRY